MRMASDMLGTKKKMLLTTLPSLAHSFQHTKTLASLEFINALELFGKFTNSLSF